MVTTSRLKNLRTRRRTSKRSSKRSSKQTIRSFMRSRRRRRRRTKSKRRSKMRYTSKCKQYLQDKIRINMDEYKSGRFSSRQQAIAVSYSQTIKKHPSCKRVLTRK